MDEEINNRINSAATAFARIRSKVIRSHDLPIQTKSAGCRAVCMSTLLYCCETWTLHRKHVKRLVHFHIQCERKILIVTWQNRIPNTELLSRAGLTSIECMLLCTDALRRPCFSDARFPVSKTYDVWGASRKPSQRCPPKKVEG